MDEDIVARMRELGFSLYEARLYVALLRGGAQNGNEVAKSANVPSSKVYAALDKLAAEGVVQSFRRGSSTRFTVIPPQDLISRLRRRFKEPIEFLEEELPKLASSEPPEPYLTVSGEPALLEAARSIVDAASQELHLSCWESELEQLADAIVAADARGVQIYGMLYGDVELPPGEWLRHHYEDIVASRIGGRLLAVVADSQEALIALVAQSGDASAVRSRNPVMTMIVEEYLRHDNILQRAQLKIGFDEWDRWWQADPEARVEILGRALGQGAAGAADAVR